jgi:hypothetical protein
MSSGNKQLASDVLRILHGARSLPPAEAVEALRPFLESVPKKGSGDKLADASFSALRNCGEASKKTTRRRTTFGKKPSTPP